MDFDLGLSTRVLSRTPGVLRAQLEGLPDPWTRTTEGPDTFSPFDVVGHLIDGEETDWVPRARIILAGGPDTRFEPYDRFRHRARNAGLGNVTLRQLLATWVVHDLGHLAQISRVMAKQLRVEVGPWEPFLPVLTDHETPRS